MAKKLPYSEDIKYIFFRLKQYAYWPIHGYDSWFRQPKCAALMASEHLNGQPRYTKAAINHGTW